MELAAEIADVLIALFFGCGLPILVLTSVCGLVVWMTQPVLRASEAEAPVRFQLTDLIWLLVELQMAMALATYAIPATMPATVRVWVLMFLCIPMLLFWVASLRIVSGAGIRHPLPRAAVFVVYLPGVVASLLGLPLFVLDFTRSLAPSGAGSLPGEGPYVTGGRLAALLIFALSLRWIARWAVSGAQPRWRSAS
jgi:hypothetical protein